MSDHAIATMSLKITLRQLLPHLLGANELTNGQAPIRHQTIINHIANNAKIKQNIRNDSNFLPFEIVISFMFLCITPTD